MGVNGLLRIMNTQNRAHGVMLQVGHGDGVAVAVAMEVAKADRIAGLLRTPVTPGHLTWEDISRYLDLWN